MSSSKKGRRHAGAGPDAPAADPARGLILFVAFAGGWTVMMLEILGGRLLAPYFGYSIYQWGALIGVVLGFMAAGYFVGGRVGDTPLAVRFLVFALSASLAWVLVSPLLGGTLLAAARGYGPAWGAVLASCVLLGIPSLLLAAVSPVVARLTAQGGIASTAGTVYGVSTMGSIGGTFFAAFYAIPEIGTRHSYYLAAGLLLLAVAALLVAARRLRLAAAPVAALLVAALPIPESSPPAVFETESLHNLIRVEDRGDRRLLYLNYRDGPQSFEQKGELLTGSYYDYFLLAPALGGGAKVLFLGAAGGVALKQLAQVWPAAEVTGVELDPAVISVAREYFGLDAVPAVKLVADDARWHLATSEELYDVVAIDLYVTGHIPFFTTTAEFFREVYDHLRPGGMMIMNVLSIQAGDDLIGPMVNSVRRSFASSFLVGWGNIMLIGTKSPATLEEMRARLSVEALPEAIEPVAHRALKTLRVGEPDPRWPVFTDDLNDVDFRSFRMFYGRP